MNLPAFTLMFEVVFAVLLLVTIVYAVKLNIRISGLRERDSELREMIEQFNEASNQALDSVRILKSTGVDADRQFKALIDRAQALRDDLAYMIEHGERIADRIEPAPIQQRSNTGLASGPVSAAEAHGPSRKTADEASAASGAGADENRQYRSEIEQALAQVIGSTAMVG